MPTSWILRLGALLGLLMLASPGFAADLSFTWKLAPTAEIPAESPGPEPQSWELEVELRDDDRILCLGGSYEWSIDGLPVTARRRGLCSFSLPLSALGERSLAVVDQRTGAASDSVPVQLQELVVAIMGDSVASGDGTPARRFLAVPRWRDRACGRSDAAGTVEAVSSLEAQDPGTAITVINVACSGAGITAGILAPQGPQAETAQVDAVVEAAGGRAISAILLTAGANDAGFGDLIRTCLVDETRADCRGLTSAPGRPPLSRDIPQRVSTLSGLYDSLAACLAQESCGDGPGLGVDPSRILIAPYFDPTRDELGATCRWPQPDFTRAITAPEMAWMRETLLAPLNAAVEDSALRHGWVHLPEPGVAFATHGICAARPWVIAPQLSLLRQGDLRGSFHPDGDGQECYRRSFGRGLAPILAGDGLEATPPAACAP